eukprot:5076239-Pyramimonas_sp.AAC.1
MRRRRGRRRGRRRRRRRTSGNPRAMNDVERNCLVGRQYFEDPEACRNIVLGIFNATYQPDCCVLTFQNRARTPFGGLQHSEST